MKDEKQIHNFSLSMKHNKINLILSSLESRSVLMLLIIHDNILVYESKPLRIEKSVVETIFEVNHSISMPLCI